MATKHYGNDDIVVHWDAQRCIHTGICTRGLPAVFDVRRRPWIAVDGADADAIAALVERCPTGALRYDRRDGAAQESAPAPTTVVAMRNGPLYVRGDVAVTTPEGSMIARETRVALCRCGATSNPPFCDSSHRGIGYRSNDPEVSSTREAAASPAEICAPQDLDDPP